jgi:hypothetical protein
MAIAALRPVAAVADETSSWPYRHDLDLTGFIDGTENPTLIDAPELVLISDMLPIRARRRGTRRRGTTNCSRALDIAAHGHRDVAVGGPLAGPY